MLVGTHLGPYDILAEIGKGGMANVYRARQLSMERDVAIKIMPRGASDPAAVQRFQREARLIARLEHPHILPVYDFDGAHDPPYIVMRYLDGGTLEDLLARGALPLVTVTQLLRQVCSALAYAHRQGVVHRDIKPSNILIDREGNGFVSDFGIARSSTGQASLRLTQEGIVLGSVEYMSPEQVMGRRDLDHHSDIYSIGVMLFQMLSGRLPFVADPPLGVLAMHVQSPVPSASALNDSLPPAVDEVIFKSMAKNPLERFHSAVELSAAFEAAMGGAVLPDLARPPEPARLPSSPVPASVTPADGSSKTAVTEQTRQVAVVYASAAEYAEMLEAGEDSETAFRVMIDLWESFERLVTGQGGEVLTRTDNDLLSVWGAGTLRSGDPEQAVLAALAMQNALREQGHFHGDDNQLPLNIGIHSGPALVSPQAAPARASAHSITGATISLAYRLMQAAYGTILITHDVYRQVRGIFDVLPDLPLPVRGRLEGIQTYRVSAAKQRAFPPPSSGVEGVETRMIGRESELKRLKHAFLNAIEDAETQVVTISGDAGVGKTRLLNAFDDWCELRPEMYFLFRGRPAGTLNRAYGLVRDMIAFRFQIQGDDPPEVVVRKLEEGVAGMAGFPDSPLRDPTLAHHIGHLCGYDLTSSPYLRPLLSEPGVLAAQSRQAFIQFIFTLAREDIVMIELEDLHLADDASLDLFRECFAACADSSEDTHLMAACAARPALFTRRPDWDRNQSYHIRLDLQPLDRRESRDLVRELLRKVPEVPRPLRDLLVSSARGNPYFLEELVKMLIDDRVILPESDAAWRVEESRLAALKMPPSLAALIEARLDTLLQPERLVLLRASVFGRIFYSGVLDAMDQVDAAAFGTGAHVADLPGVLSGLARRAFISQNAISAFAGAEEYAFAQSLLRDVVYDLLLDRQRKIYHRAAADWLAGLGRADEYLLQIAEHYEQAGAWSRAAEMLGRAGDRACRHGLFMEAEDLYERALSDLPGSDEDERLVLLLGLGDAANGRSDLTKAQPALDEALALAIELDDFCSEATARYLLGLVATTRGDYTEARQQFDLALPLAREHADARVLANVLYGLAETYFRCGDPQKSLQAGRECRDLAASLGDDALLATVLNRMGTVHEMLSETEAARALFEEGLLLARRAGHRRIEVSLLTNIGLLSALSGDWVSAAASWETARPAMRELGDLFGLNLVTSNLSVACARLGQLDRVMPLSIESLQAARQMRSNNGLLRGLIGIGYLRLAQGDIAGGMALMGLLRSHPAASSDSAWGVDLALEYWQERLGITASLASALMEPGKQLNLEKVVKETLREE